MLLQQGYDVDALLRLIGGEIRLARPGDPRGVDLCPNRPSHREGYEAFRRVIAHLSWIQDRHALRVEPLVLRYDWTIPAASMPPDAFQALYRDFSMTHSPEAETYHVTRQVPARVVVSNYDPETLSAEERARLNAEAHGGPPNEILVDIRPGHVGGEFPIHGQLRLRSFHEVLAFIGRGIEEEPEYDVKPDPRTPAISENPVETLGILEARDLPPGVNLSVDLEGLPLRAQAGDRLPVESEGVQPALPGLPDDGVGAGADGTGDLDREVGPVSRARSAWRRSSAACADGSRMRFRIS